MLIFGAGIGWHRALPLRHDQLWLWEEFKTFSPVAFGEKLRMTLHMMIDYWPLLFYFA
jgi:hypothetical protein